MQKKILCLVLTLTIVCLAESSPVNLGSLEFDNLDTDFADLGYEVEDDSLDGFEKLLGIGPEGSKKKNEKSKDAAKTTVKNLGFVKKNIVNKGVQAKNNEGDLNQFFKTAKAHDHGVYDDADVYTLAEAIASTAAADKVKATRTYKKGKKTRGYHRVHHKDEYKKDQEFYEDDETKGTINKVAAKGLGTKVSAGAGFNKGIFNHDREKDLYGKQGYLDNGFVDREYNVFSDSRGFDGSFSNEGS